MGMRQTMTSNNKNSQGFQDNELINEYDNFGKLKHHINTMPRIQKRTCDSILTRNLLLNKNLARKKLGTAVGGDRQVSYDNQFP